MSANRNDKINLLFLSAWILHFLGNPSFSAKKALKRIGGKHRKPDRDDNFTTKFTRTS